MKVTPLTLWASSIALLGVPGVSAKPTGTETSTAATTTTSEEPSCTASLITKLCDYKEPGPEFAVASSGKEHCWGYCNDHQPCNFVIFVAGNPHTGTGTCWLYPDEDYDDSAGSPNGCSNQVVEVYDKPECEDEGGSSPTTTSTPDKCEATESPSAIAEVCDYPDPGRDCFYDCYASESASNCLSLCAEKGCNYVVFNPHNPSNTPHSSGTCWVYADGKYNPDDASDCKGEPEQFVYKNTCPKPKSASSSSEPSESTATESTDGSGTAAANNENDDDDDEDAASTLTFSLSGLLALGLAML